MSALLLRRPHIALIRRPLALAAGVVGTMALLCALIAWQARRAEAGRVDAEQQLGVAQSELAAIRTSDAEVEDNLRRYRVLVDDGFVGDGDRLAWTEALLDAQQSLALPPLTFELAARRSLNAAADAAPLPDGSVPALPALPATGAQAHDLQFSIDGIHEGELLALIERVRLRKVGHFRVQDCLLQRRLQLPGLRAECTLRWITFAPMAATAATEPTP